MKPFPRFYITALAVALIATFSSSPAPAQLLPPSPLDDIGGPLGDPMLDDMLNDVEDQLERTLEEPIDDPLVESPIGDPLAENPVDDLLSESPVDDPLGEIPLGDVVESGDLLDGSGISETLEETAGGIGDPVKDALNELGPAVDDTAAAVSAAARAAVDTARGAVRPFVEGVDPFGRAIEEDTLMVLIEPAALAKLERSGWPVSEIRQLRSLGLVLVRITEPAAPSLAQAAGGLRAQFPDAAVDYNFLYRLADAGGAAPESADAGAPDTPAPTGARTRIGLIDSAVLPEHPALSGADVISLDFAPHEGARPLGHGTAVASILAATAGDGTEILAASVFFQKPGYAPGATTESLIGALDWLAGSGVDVINMSLAGPADALLERALSRIAVDGPTVVAAVGNNGPAGEPLYPAAYESVVGVTAIDSEQRVFAYANRGRHVEFAAPGVAVRVANIPDGFRLESGTSMASPYVSAVIAAALRETGLPKKALLETLRTSAEDLGDEGFDPVFGYGLVQPPRNQNSAASLTE